MILRLTITATALLLAGCDIPGLGPDPKIAQREAEAKAIGGACRYGLRSIEDCYTLNEKASKADMFAGWKDMDAYMRENKIEGVKASAVVAAQPTEEFMDDPKAKSSATKEKPGHDAAGKPPESKPKAGEPKPKSAASKPGAPAEAKTKAEAKPAEKQAAH